MTSTKRILIVSTNPFAYDGISNVITNYHEKISNSKLKFDFAVSLSSDQGRLTSIGNIFDTVHFLPDRKQCIYKYIYSFYGIAKKCNYDIIHLHGNSGTMTLDLLIALTSGIKVRIAHSHNTTCSHPLLHKILKPFLNRLATFNFACSKGAGDWLFNGQYLVLNNGIDTDKFSFSNDLRVKHRSALNLQDKTVIGHVGHFSYQKNHEFIINVFKEVFERRADFHLLLIGEGPSLISIVNLISEYQLVGAVTILAKRNDVNELLSAMDIFVLPSRFEGLPLSGIEAQAAGIPTFVSDAITTELDLSETVCFLPIADTKPWVDHIISCKGSSRQSESRKNILLLQKKGYDIASNAKILEAKYLSMGE